MEEPKATSNSRKRPLENEISGIQNSPYYKMRAVLGDLRPHFIEVLKTPDFRNCKAAGDIREGMKLLMDLYKEMTSQSIKLERCSNGSIDNGQKPLEPVDDLLHNGSSNNHVKGSYIVGGSAFGWNFITFHGSDAVYYGQTKEAFRAKNPKTN